MKIFDNPIERRNTNSIKWEKEAIESVSANRDALPFWVADMDYPAEEHIKEKAKEISTLGAFGYPDFPSFTSTSSSWLKRKHNWDVDSSHIEFAMGLLHGISIAINLFTKEGDNILIPSPTYRPFRELAIRNHRTMLDYPLEYHNNEFSLDRVRFDNLAAKSQMILFCSPHNPSGLVFGEDDLLFVLEEGKKYNIPVISDEIHADLVHPGKTHIPMGKANEKVGADTITFMAPSKTFNLAGEHSAIAIFSSLKMQERFKKAKEALFLTTPGYLIGELTETAYNEGLEYNKELCSYLGENASFIKEFFNKSKCGIKMVNGEASFVTFLDCSAVYDKIKNEVEVNSNLYSGGKDGGILSRFFGVKSGVAMNDGSWFGEEYSRFVRFNYGTSLERVKEALINIEKAVLDL